MRTSSPSWLVQRDSSMRNSIGAEPALLLVRVDERHDRGDHVARADRREREVPLPAVETAGSRLGAHPAHPRVGVGVVRLHPRERVEVARRHHAAPGLARALRRTRSHSAAPPGSRRLAPNAGCRSHPRGRTRLLRSGHRAMRSSRHRGAHPARAVGISGGAGARASWARRRTARQSPWPASSRRRAGCARRVRGRRTAARRAPRLPVTRPHVVSSSSCMLRLRNWQPNSAMSPAAVEPVVERVVRVGDPQVAHAEHVGLARRHAPPRRSCARR